MAIIDGTTGNDNLEGTPNADIINGFEGDDQLFGRAGNDRLKGGAGLDRLYGFEGDDTLNGEAGSDWVFAGEGNDVLNGDIGDDLLLGEAGSDTIYGGEGEDDLRGGDGDDLLHGGAGDDWLLGDWNGGAPGNDRLNGGEGNDNLNGQDGDDVLDGGVGADTFWGGAGSDKFYVDNVGDKVIEDNVAGIDVVSSSVSFATGGQHIENVLLTGSASINATGNALNNYLVGNSGANIISGGAGNDVLSGGAGRDAFVFNTAANSSTNRDTISDFSVADDTIWMDNAIFAALGATGALAAAAFRIGAGAADASDRIVYNASNGALYYDADGSGSGAAVQFASIGKGLALTNADFLVI